MENEIKTFESIYNISYMESAKSKLEEYLTKQRSEFGFITSYKPDWSNRYLYQFCSEKIKLIIQLDSPHHFYPFNDKDLRKTNQSTDKEKIARAIKNGFYIVHAFVIDFVSSEHVLTEIDTIIANRNENLLQPKFIHINSNYESVNDVYLSYSKSFNVSPHDITERCNIKDHINISRTVYSKNICNTSESMLYDWLQKEFPELDFVHQKSFDWCRNPETGNPYIYDFCSLKSKILIECDGEDHFKATFVRGTDKNFFDKTAFINKQNTDMHKNASALKNGFSLIRIDQNIFNKQWEHRLKTAIDIVRTTDNACSMLTIHSNTAHSIDTYKKYKGDLLDKDLVTLVSLDTLKTYNDRVENGVENSVENSVEPPTTEKKNRTNVMVGTIIQWISEQYPSLKFESSFAPNCIQTLTPGKSKSGTKSFTLGCENLKTVLSIDYFLFHDSSRTSKETQNVELDKTVNAIKGGYKCIRMSREYAESSDEWMQSFKNAFTQLTDSNCTDRLICLPTNNELYDKVYKELHQNTMKLLEKRVDA